MPTPREYLAVGVVNGVLYAVGGYTMPGGAQTASDAVEAYDPVTNSWTAKASMPTARGFLAVAVVNGILYAIGGASGGIVEAYDPTTNTWTTKAPMPTTRSGLGLGVINGLVYAVGGVPNPGASLPIMDTLEIYNPSANSWSRGPHMPTPRSEDGVGVINNRLYVLGGYAPMGPGGYGFVATNEAYRP
jgi:N-acetylneuraminic acid mutarotase